MRSDLTCPIEVTRVQISNESRENGTEQVVCQIDFHLLEEGKTVDSVQMNIVCFDEHGQRLGGRLVRAHAHDHRDSEFSGTFRPEHVDGTARVDASVEKVWFKDGVIWRREERNVRSYTPNNLPEGRELDRLRSAAGEDAVGYAREDDTVWLCVCGRANRTSDEKCRRCGRERVGTLTAFSKEAIEATLGEKERALEAKSKESFRRSSEQNAREMEEAEKHRKQQKRKLRRIIVLLCVVIFALAAWRWLVPLGVDFYAGRQMADGKAAEAREIYEWIERFWPGEYDAAEKALDAERVIIRRLIDMGTEDTLKSAVERAEAIEDEALTLEANLALAQCRIDLGKEAEAEALLSSLPGDAARQMLNELIYSQAAAAKEKLEFETAIDRFGQLGTYLDSEDQRTDSIYLLARQLMREGKMEEASERFLQVAGYLDSLSLLRRCRYALAAEKREAGDLVEAAVLYESLGVYEEAELLGRQCRYEAALAAIEAGDLSEAAEQLKMAEDYEDARERFDEVAFSLGTKAIQEEDYETAIFWLEQLPLNGEVQDLYNQAVYGYAAALEKAGSRLEAALQYASLGEYLDAQDKAKTIEYNLAIEAMAAGSYEEALDRLEGLDTFLDSKRLVETCKRELADRAFAAGAYEEAISYYEQMEDRQEAESQILRCRYDLAAQKAVEGAYDEAAELYRQCGVYLDAEEKTVEMRYSWAAYLESEGRYQEAADAFRALGGYLDAPQCTQRCEDLWLAEPYRNARLDLEAGNYLGVLEILEPYLTVQLPERYSDIPDMVEQANLNRALELIDIGHPLDALPFLEKIPDNKTAKKRLSDYVYQVIGRWKDRTGNEYIFRRDGTCTIPGAEGYYGGSGYELFFGEEPYPTRKAFQVVNLRGTSLTLKDLQNDRNVRLTYVGEPTPAESSDGEEELQHDVELSIEPAVSSSSEAGSGQEMKVEQTEG